MREYILRHKDPERREKSPSGNVGTHGRYLWGNGLSRRCNQGSPSFLAGLSLGESDVLRRGMSGKFRSREEFQLVKDKFISNCRTKGYTDQLTLEVWNQVESFAGYAFAKGHSRILMQ